MGVWLDYGANAASGNNMKTFATIAVAVAAVAANAGAILYFPSASDPDRQGFVRVINHSASGGEVSITATDDSGLVFDAVSLPIEADETVHFNSDDLETGSEAKGIQGIGTGVGDWRLKIASDLDVEALAYIRTSDGFLTSMLDVVARIGHRHRIATFNPASNVNQVSLLRIVNEGESAVRATVVGVDGRGATSEAVLTLPAGRALTVDATDLESGEAPASWPDGATLEGGLGDGAGKWQLVMTADAELVVVNLMSTPAGHVTNLSAVPDLLWRGLVVEPESRCADAPYDRDEYGTRYRSKEDDIIEELGSIFGPYTGTCYESETETDIEHMVALAEAHESGMCLVDTETKRTFAGDLLNLTLAAPDVNRAKGSLDAFDWVPEMNRCWFADRVLRVRLKYGMTVDRDEAEALELILAGCESTEIVKPECAD